MGLRPLVLLQTVVVSGALLRGQASVLTWHNDNGRTGQNLLETVLTPANVNSSTFGRLATLNVDGKVDAQPLYVPGVPIPNQGVHNVLYVATEHGSLYAFDADTFVLLRMVSLLGAGETPSDDHGCNQVTPEIGITATPAIDLQAGPSGMIYLIAYSKDASQKYHHRLHALDLPTLTEQLGGPAEIHASYPGKGAENTFDPAVHVERPGLLISNGVIYTSWGSHCDGGAYAGWVISYSGSTLAQLGVLNLIPNGSNGGVWAAGSGPAIDASGNLFLLTGNGSFDTTLNSSGFPSKSDFGNAFVKIAASGLSVADYFTMLNTVSESDADVDLGSGGLMLLPPLDDGSGTMVSLLVGAGKDKNIYVLDQTNLGKFSPNMDSIYQLLSGALPGGSWASPAWFNGRLYYGGVGDSLKAFGFNAGRFTLASHSSDSFGFPGVTPSVSASGTSNGIVWAVENQNPAILHAYAANNVATELYNSNQAPGGRDQFGNGNKFIVPTIASGKVYVGTTSGVGVFGLLNAITVASIQNAASNATGPIAPGEIVVLKGSGMGPAQLAQFQVGNRGYISTQLAGTGVFFNGVAAPLIYTSSTAVAAIVPYAVTSGVASIVVQYQNQSSPPLAVPVAASAPGTFTALSTGAGQAAAINQDGSYNSPAHPAKIGSIISLYETGEGQTSPPGIDGKPATAPYPVPGLPVTVTIGGVPATNLQYAGGAPGEVAGLLQINVAIPAGVTPGSTVPVLINVGSAASQTGVTVAVSAN